MNTPQIFAPVVDFDRWIRTQGFTAGQEARVRLVRALRLSLSGEPVDGFVDQQPLELPLSGALPPAARFYIWSATNHISERQRARWKIQLVHGRPRNRNRFDWSNGHMVYLLGYVSDFDIWIVFDARVREGPHGFSYSTSAYVEEKAVYRAVAAGESSAEMSLKKPPRIEQILLASPSNLGDTLEERYRQHMKRALA